MLSQLRNASKGPLAIVLVGLLVLAFGTWGISGIFLSSPADAVAKVGDRKIRAGEFQREFSFVLDMRGRQLDRYITPVEARKQGLDRMFLEQLITRTALDAVTGRLGLTTPDSVLREAIVENESFHDVTGEFDRQYYNEVLRSNRLSESMFEDMERGIMTRRQLLDAVAGGTKPPKGMAEALYRYRTETRQVDYILLQPNLVGKIPDPSKKDLAAFHKNQADKYTAPELRSFSYMLLRPEDLMARAAENVPDDTVQAIYKSREKQYVVPEKRHVRQITFKERDKAEAALKRIRSGAAFMTVAKETGHSESGADLGEVHKTSPAFADPKVAEAAFAFDKPGVSDVIEGMFGYVIVEVSGITPSSTRSFEDVREELRKELAREEAAGIVEKIEDDITDALAEQSSTLEALAKKHGLPFKTVEQVTKEGLDADGKKINSLPADPVVLTAAFEGDVGDDMALERLSGDGYFVVRVDDIQPSALRPLKSIRARVVRDWKADHLRGELASMAADLTERINGGETIAAVAKDAGLAALSKGPVNRYGAGEDLLSQPVLDAIFASREREAVGGPVRNGDSYVVVQLRRIIRPDVTTPRARLAIQQLMDQFDQQYGIALADQFASSLRREMGVKYYENVLEQAVTNTR